jgi:pyrroloquinoline quinone (PQQ) biosynthesis protein C
MDRAQISPDRMDVPAEEYCRALIATGLSQYDRMNNHPMIRAAAEGKATLEQLREFGTGMYQVVHDAQRWTAAAYAGCEDQAIRAVMLKSMLEEETGVYSKTVSHSEQIADFLEAVGQPRAVTYERAKRLKKHFKQWADFSEFLGRCRPYWLFRGVISMAGEAQFTEVCATMIKALPQHYGVKGKGLVFWEVHGPIDVEHTDNAVQITSPYLTTPERRQALQDYFFQHIDFRYRAWLEPLGEIKYSVA